MARPARFHRGAILGAARDLAAERGPTRLTLAGLSDRLSAPIGSIYHRYPSREALLADLWLDTVESFQPEFLAPLSGGEPVSAGLEAVAFAMRWVRENNSAARLLLIHRREDFIEGPWPEAMRQRAEDLATRAEDDLKSYCRRLYGRASARGLARIRFALSEIPQAAARPYLHSGKPMPADAEELLVDTCRYALSRGG